MDEDASDVEQKEDDNRNEFFEFGEGVEKHQNEKKKGETTVIMNHESDADPDRNESSDSIGRVIQY